jgi:hypothetical protein
MTGTRFGSLIAAAVTQHGRAVTSTDASIGTTNRGKNPSASEWDTFCYDARSQFRFAAVTAARDNSCYVFDH